MILFLQGTYYLWLLITLFIEKKHKHSTEIGYYLVLWWVNTRTRLKVFQEGLSQTRFYPPSISTSNLLYNNHECRSTLGRRFI